LLGTKDRILIGQNILITGILIAGFYCISQGIIYQTYIAIKDSLFKLYSKLLELGYHPKPWKQAIGVILKKPGKPPENYSYPKGYRVISLLNCLGKVSERILAQRLLYVTTQEEQGSRPRV
jgi:hypothetical protein